MLRRVVKLLVFCVGGLVPTALLAAGAGAGGLQAPGSVVGAPVSPPASPLQGVGYTPVTSARLLDTRLTGATIDDIDEGGGPLAANTTRTIAIAGRGGVPATGVEAIALHITAVNQTQRTFVTVWPSDFARPTTSNLNPTPAAPASNLVIVKLGAAGDVSLYNFVGSVNLIVDVVGYFPTGPVFDGLGPDRVLDTRIASDPIGPGETIELQLAGIVGVPASGVEAVALNVTAVGATTRTFITVHPLDTLRPPTSNLNAALGTVAANHVIAELGTDGKISIYNDSGNVHVIVDVMGWFADGPGYTTVSPTRLVDTRPGSPLGPNSTRIIPLAGNAGLPPAGLGAVVFNLTAVNATGATFLTVFPGGATRPNTSDLNPRPGVVAPNLVIAEVGPDGTVQLYNSSGTVDVLVDIIGWMPSNVVATDDSATVVEDAAATVIDVTDNDDDFDGGPLLVQSVTQPANGTVALSGGGTTVSYSPDADYCNNPPGTTLDTFTYTLYGEATATVTVTVDCVGDAPTTDGDSATVLEDSGATAIDVLANDDDIDGGPMTVDSVTQPANGTVVITGGGTGLTYTPDPEYCHDPPASALDTFTYTLNGGDAGTVAVTVTCVNDVPSFTEGADESVLADSGPQTVADWATAISAGPSNESSQTVEFAVTGNTNAALFSAGPAVAANGTLTYTPAANANGVATITIEIDDDGGTADGGVDTSATQSFTITVTSVNDTPSFTKGGDQTVAEDAGAQSVATWATAISKGPADESGQTLTFNVTNNTNAALFSAGPAIATNGTLTYTPAANQHGSAIIAIELQDNGGGAATSATQSFTITVTAVNDTPTSIDGAWTVQANMQRSVVAGSGLLSNASDAADVAGDAGYTPTFSVGSIQGNLPVAGTISATLPGVGTVVADAATGAFTIDPAPGVTGPVEFDYTVCDIGDGAPASQCSAAVTADITISGPVIWFVDPTAATNGTGTLTSPFNTLAAADAVDAAGHRVFVYSGTTATGLTLNEGEWLIGQSATGPFDTLFGITPPAGTSTRPTMGTGTATIGGTVTLATNAKVQGVGISAGTSAGLVGSGGLTGITVSETSVTTTTGTAVNLSSATGTYMLSSVTTSGAANGILLDSLGTSAVTVNGGAIVNATSRGVDINGGTGAFSYDGTITTTSAGRSVEITNHTGGTVAFSGSITDNGLGVNLGSNSGGTIDFTGGVTVSSGANPAFAATGGGTVNVTGSTNTLSTTTGAALNVSNTAIGASGLTFRSISANGAANGIVLNSTGASGGLTVQGTGSAGSGGTIQNTSGAGIVLTSTRGVSLTRMLITNTSGSGVDGTQVVNFSLTNSTVSGSGSIAVDGTSNLAFNDLVAGTENNLSGTVVITGNSLTTAAWHGVDILNFSGSITSLNISTNTITSSTSVATSLGSGVRVQTLGSAGGAASLGTTTISTNTVTNFPSGGGVLVLGGNSASAAAPPADLSSVTIDGNTIRGESAVNRMNTNAILTTMTGTGTGTFAVTNNTLSHTVGTTIGFGSNGITTGNFTIRGNTITANNSFSASGIGGGSGVVFANGNAATTNATITSNTITNTQGSGILAVARGGAGQLNVKIINNNVSALTGSFADGIRVDAGNGASTDDQVCLEINSNITSGVGVGSSGIGLRKQGTIATINDFAIEGLVGSASPGVENYVNSINTSAGGVVLISATSGFTSCTVP